MDILKTDILVVGGGTGGTAAAIQAARRGRGTQVMLVSEGPWLGGMLSSAGVSAPDGNELAAFQTGLWGAFLQALAQRQVGGLDHAWVSFFTYEPQVAAQIFADWVKALPNLDWRQGYSPREVLRQGDRITGVAFDDFTVEAKLTLDATELGDVLALGEVPFRWGWEVRSQWQEPSAPKSLDDPTDPLYAMVQRYPVQAPTWVVVMQDMGAGMSAPPIAAPSFRSEPWPGFTGAWQGYEPDSFLNYGRLPGNRFMINWPQNGNDYGVCLHRLIGSHAERQAFWQEAQQHSQAFAHFIQAELGQRYGLADNMFPTVPGNPGGGAFALQPYYRESRRLVGLATVTETAILPMSGAQVAALPINQQGEVSAIAIGNYPNDHHYPGFSLPLAPKALRWGGRWSGTPFTIPFEALIPESIDGLLACEKNISVSHIANGATRLQPLVLSIGQAAGMAAALCLEQTLEPRHLSVRTLQDALLNDDTAPLAIVPTYNLLPNQPEWVSSQQRYLNHPDTYPSNGYSPLSPSAPTRLPYDLAPTSPQTITLEGRYEYLGEQSYCLHLAPQAPDTVGSSDTPTPKVTLVTLYADLNQQLRTLQSGDLIQVRGRFNPAGQWLLLTSILHKPA
jgi:FAD dependent oxidoreductase